MRQVDIAIHRNQGLSQDFKTAPPIQQHFQNDPSNPFWELGDFCEPGSDFATRFTTEKNGSTHDRCYNHTLLIKLQEYTHLGNHIGLKIFIKLYNTKTIFIKYVDIFAVLGVCQC